MFLVRVSILLIGLFIIGGTASAQENIVTEAPNWCGFAQKYLPGKDGRQFDCANAGRCIKLNNYGCSQNHGTRAFPGQLKTADGKAAHDAQFHVAYEHPKWSLMKSIGTLRRYQVDLGKKSSLSIAETYAPWCDTIGSKKQRLGWGRTCKDRLPSVDRNFSPRCEKPASGGSSANQCRACNCPDRLAAFYIQGSGVSNIGDEIKLFDESQLPTATMQSFLKQVSRMELGYRVTDDLIREAIQAYHP